MLGTQRTSIGVGPDTALTLPETCGLFRRATRSRTHRTSSLLPAFLKRAASDRKYSRNQSKLLSRHVQTASRRDRDSQVQIEHPSYHTSSCTRCAVNSVMLVRTTMVLNRDPKISLGRKFRSATAPQVLSSQQHHFLDAS